jgi:hypothetical protein
MIKCFLAVSCPGGFEFLLILLLGFLFFGIPIILLIYLIKFLGSVPKEQTLLRMELGKLAEEVHQIRNELKAEE